MCTVMKLVGISGERDTRGTHERSPKRSGTFVADDTS